MIYGKEIIVIFAGYLVGCVTMGYYLVRLIAGRDIRSAGSGNVGARNVGRVLGAKGFIITFAGDFSKGLIVMLTASAIQLEYWAIQLVLLAVVAGHIWPIQLRFKGGKGVAVTLGALAVWDYRFLLVLCIVFAVGYACCRKYIISGMIAILLLPVTAVLTGRPTSDIITIVVLTLVVLLAHRTNICQCFRSDRVTDKPVKEREV